MKDRVILHCDINSFFASVELLDHPELAGRPVAVSGAEDSRHGIILAKNQEAKAFGVQTAETVRQARQKCPDLVLLPPHREKYRDFNHRINTLFQEYTDQVEPFSIDESWLDVTASQRLFGSGRAIADDIRRRVREELGITLSAGVSWNKIFAKMGSEYKKPDATTEITRENYRDLLWVLPVERFFFVGFATAQKLHGIGISTVGDLAQADPAALSSLLGKQGPLLRSYARGEDTSPVAAFNQRSQIKSVGNGMTFRRDLTTEDDIRTALTHLADTVSTRLRKYGLFAGGVRVELKDASFRTSSRQTQFDRPTDLASELRASALALIRTFWWPGTPIRLITLTGIHLTAEEMPDGLQLSLFGATSGDGPVSGVGDPGAADQEHERSAAVEQAVDRIRERFGSSSIGYGGLIDNDIGIDV